MALTFPANPTNGQIYDQYVYDATAQTWRVYGSDTGITNVLATKANLSGGNTFSGNQTFNNYIVSPNTPRFYVKRSGTTTGYNPSNQTNVVQFDTVQHNIGNAFNTSTGKFTAPVSGLYAFIIGQFQNVAVSQLWPVLNGVRVESFLTEAATGNHSASFVRYLNANDNIGVCAWSNGNTNVSVYADSFHNYFIGFLVG